MQNSTVALLIKEPDSQRPRYVEVERLPFTVGNAANADVLLRNAEGRVRMRFVWHDGVYWAQNLADSKPGRPLRTLKLANKTRFKSGGVFFQFFTTTLSATAVAERIVAMDFEVEKVRFNGEPKTWDTSLEVCGPGAGATANDATTAEAEVSTTHSKTDDLLERARALLGHLDELAARVDALPDTALGSASVLDLADGARASCEPVSE